MRETTKGLRERSRQYAHLLANLETILKANDPTAFTWGYQRLNHARRYRRGLIRTHDQRGDAKRSIDATPTMFGEIHDNEDVTGKKWIHGVPQSAGVSNGTPQSRQEISETQSMQIELRSVLLVSERSRDEPALAWP
jgi:hypothetical protein